MDKISVNGYTFAKSEKLLPTIMDFEALIKFMAESGNTALLQRRVGQRAFQEFFESGGFYPEGLGCSHNYCIICEKRIGELKMAKAKNRRKQL